MLANLDREVMGVPDVQILECKTAGEFGARLWRDGVPEYVQLQVQHQLAVTGSHVQVSGKVRPTKVGSKRASPESHYSPRDLHDANPA